MPNEGMNVKTPQSDEWRTPPWLFKALDAEFGFSFDGAARWENRLLPRWTDDIAAACGYKGPVEEGKLILADDRIFVNPPYSIIDKFVQYALQNTYGPRLWVMLLPSRTGTEWFQRLHDHPRVELRFLRKRVEFLDAAGQPSGSPRFDSLIAIVRPR